MPKTRIRNKNRKTWQNENVSYYTRKKSIHKSGNKTEGREKKVQKIKINMNIKKN